MGSVLSTLNSLTNQLIAFFRQEKPKEMHWNSLPEKVVVDIFSRMTPTELLATERVDRNWQRLVRETLNKNIETVVMRSVKERYDWSLCHHLKNTRKTMSLEKMFDYILKEKQKVIEEALAREYRNVLFSDGIRKAKGLQLFTSCLSKLRGVKSIDLRKLKVSVQTLVQVFEVCPKLECIAIKGFNEFLFDGEIPFINRTTLNEDDWIKFVNSFKHQIVHLVVCEIDNSERLFNLLGNYSNNLLNLEMIGFEFNTLTEEIVTTIKQLQKTKKIYVMVDISENNEPVSLDLIDEIIFSLLHWNFFSDHLHRLSLLRFLQLRPNLDSPDQFKSIQFVALKTLVVAEVTNFVLQVLTRSQFSALEKLKVRFNIFEELNDVDQMFGLLFEKMSNLIKIDIQYYNEVQHQMPGPSILRLNSLTEITWRVTIRLNWDIQVMIDSFEVLGQVASLKKLSFKYMYLDHFSEHLQNQWRLAIEQQLATLKIRRPELVVDFTDSID